MTGARPGWAANSGSVSSAWRPGWAGPTSTYSLGGARPLTGVKLKGWQWDTRPKPAKYLGGKTDVPSNKPKTVPVEATPERWAGGWDIDRIFVDLGEPGFLTEFWTAAMAEYQLDSDADVGQSLLDAATDYPVSAAASPSVLAIVTGMAGQLRTIGAVGSYFWLSTDYWDEYSALGTADVHSGWPIRLAGSAFRMAPASLAG